MTADVGVTAVGEEDHGTVFQAHYARHARVYAARIDGARRATCGTLHVHAALVSVPRTLRAAMRLTTVVVPAQTAEKAALVVDGHVIIEA